MGTAKKKAPAPQTPVAIAPQRQMRAVWVGALQVGIITIPLKIYAGARAGRIAFKTLHERCGGAINMGGYLCKTCNVDIDGVIEKTVKGYEYSKGQFVILSAEEIEAQRPETGKLAEMSCFVRASEVDPVMFESTYYMLPGEGGQKAYELIRQSMLDTKTVAIGKITMNSSEHVVVVRPFGDGLALHLMFYLSEVNAIPYPIAEPTSKKEMDLGKMLVESMLEPFDPTQYRDEYAENIRSLVTAKLGNKEIKQVERKPVQKALPDLASALAASIAAAKSRKKAA